MTEYIMPISSGVSWSGEKNDCTVRALVNTTGMNYVDAHSIMKKHGRLNGHGTFPQQWGPAYLENGFALNGVHGDTRTSRTTSRKLVEAGYEVQKKNGISLKRFIQENQEGSFILIVLGHAVVLVDGDLIDTVGLAAKSYVAASFKKI